MKAKNCWLLAVLLLSFLRGEAAEFALVYPKNGGIEVSTTNYWRKTELEKWSPCQRNASPSCIAVIKTTDTGKTEALARDFLRTYGDIFTSSDCGIHYFTPQGADQAKAAEIFIWLPEKALTDLQREILKWGTLESWNLNPGNFQGKVSRNVYDVSLEKWEILTEEMSENKTLLKKTPHVQSLVMDEINRLEKAAVPYKEIKGKIQFKLLIKADMEPLKRDPPDRKQSALPIPSSVPDKMSGSRIKNFTGVIGAINHEKNEITFKDPRGDENTVTLDAAQLTELFQDQHVKVTVKDDKATVKAIVQHTGIRVLAGN